MVGGLSNHSHAHNETLDRGGLRRFSRGWKPLHSIALLGRESAKTAVVQSGRAFARKGLANHDQLANIRKSSCTCPIDAISSSGVNAVIARHGRACTDSRSS